MYNFKREHFENIVVRREEPIDCFIYPLSNLFALYFVDLYLKDPSDGLSQLNNYLMLPPNVTLEDKLYMYDLTGASYKRMIKRVYDYGNRHHIL